MKQWHADMYIHHSLRPDVNKEMDKQGKMAFRGSDNSCNTPKFFGTCTYPTCVLAALAHLLSGDQQPVVVL